MARLTFLLVLCISFASTAFADALFFRSRPAFSSEAAKIVLGYQSLDRNVYLQTAAKLCPVATDYVQEILKRLLAVREAAELNASPFVPQIFVSCHTQLGYTATQARGLIAIAAGDLSEVRSDDEAAFMIAHELAHVTLGHFELLTVNRFNFPLDIRSGMSGLEMEYEADDAALKWLAAAGYRPAVGAVILERLYLQGKLKGSPLDLEELHTRSHRANALVLKQ